MLKGPIINLKFHSVSLYAIFLQSPEKLVILVHHPEESSENTSLCDKIRKYV